MKPPVKIGFHALPEAMRVRFVALLPVAMGRTMVRWVPVRPADAEVLVCHGPPPRGAQRVNLCVGQPTALAWGACLVHLEAGFRAPSLIAALDQAAALVLPTREARPAPVRLNLAAFEEWLSEWREERLPAVTTY
jgi:hypothetical protein